MKDQPLLERISSNPDIFSGKPIIRGMRISVELILSLLAQGATIEEAKANLQEALELFFECASQDEITRRLHSEVYVTSVEVAVG